MMTISGKWDEDSTNKLLALRETHGRNLTFIGRMLNRTPMSCANRLTFINMTDEQRRARNSRVRERKPKPRKDASRSYHEALTNIHVPEGVLIERDKRRMAEHRDITGKILGDPPRGYSALEARA